MNKQERRELMPWTSALVDEIRKHFGEPNAISATEAGHTIEWRNQKAKPVERKR